MTLLEKAQAKRYRRRNKRNKHGQLCGSTYVSGNTELERSKVSLSLPKWMCRFFPNPKDRKPARRIQTKRPWRGESAPQAADVARQSMRQKV